MEIFILYFYILFYFFQHWLTAVLKSAQQEYLEISYLKTCIENKVKE